MLTRPTDARKGLIAGQQRSVLALRLPARRTGPDERKTSETNKGGNGRVTKRSKVVHYGYACDKREMMGKREA